MKNDAELDQFRRTVAKRLYVFTVSATVIFLVTASMGVAQGFTEPLIKAGFFFSLYVVALLIARTTGYGSGASKFLIVSDTPLSHYAELFSHALVSFVGDGCLVLCGVLLLYWAGALIGNNTTAGVTSSIAFIILCAWRLWKLYYFHYLTVHTWVKQTELDRLVEEYRRRRKPH